MERRDATQRVQAAIQTTAVPAIFTVLEVTSGVTSNPNPNPNPLR